MPAKAPIEAHQTALAVRGASIGRSNGERAAVAAQIEAFHLAFVIESIAAQHRVVGRALELRLQRPVRRTLVYVHGVVPIGPGARDWIVGGVVLLARQDCERTAVLAQPETEPEAVMTFGRRRRQSLARDPCCAFLLEHVGGARLL